MHANGCGGKTSSVAPNIRAATSNMYFDNFSELHRTRLVPSAALGSADGPSSIIRRYANAILPLTQRIASLSIIGRNPGSKCRLHHPFASSRTISEPFSPIMIAGAFVFEEAIDGIIEASITRKACTP